MKKNNQACAIMCLLVAMPLAAQAENAAVDNALSSRADLSDFYKAAQNSGVLAELTPGASYTIFAPTNEAFARFSADRYPCLYSTRCNAELAAIIGNHFVPGNVYIEGAASHEGGLYAINRRFIPIGTDGRDDYIVDGNNVLYTSAYSGGTLYKIDGLIARPRELVTLEGEAYAALPPQEHITTKTSGDSIPDPSCAPPGCPDVKIQTTTIDRTTETPVYTTP